MRQADQEVMLGAKVTAHSRPRSKPPLTFNAWLRHDFIWEGLADLPTGSRLLEIGAGQGSMGCRLAQRFEYTAIEPDVDSARVATSRLARHDPDARVLDDLAILDAQASFDVVCAFEVLEHMENDEATLRDWSQLLRPGGRIVLSVPAWQERFGPWDERVGHYRRYSPARLSELLLAADLENPSVLVYGFPLGYALETARDLATRKHHSRGDMDERTRASGRSLQPGETGGVVARWITTPFRYFQRPFRSSRLGTGLVAWASRPG